MMQQLQPQQRPGDPNLPEWAEPQTNAAPLPPDPPQQQCVCKTPDGRCLPDSACENPGGGPDNVPIGNSGIEVGMVVVAMVLGAYFLTN